MHVFEYENHRLLFGTGLQQSEESTKGLIPQLLGRELPLREVILGRNRQQGG